MGVPTSKAQSLNIRLTPASPKRTTPFLPAQTARILWRRSRGRNWMLSAWGLSEGRNDCELHMVRELSMRTIKSSLSVSDVVKSLWPRVLGCSQSDLGHRSFKAGFEFKCENSNQYRARLLILTSCFRASQKKASSETLEAKGRQNHHSELKTEPLSLH